MDYSSFPNAPAFPADVPGTNEVTSKGIFGSGTLGSGGRLNLGGPGGAYVDGDQGFFAGSEKAETAPFWVNLQGDAVLNSAAVTGSLTAGPLTGQHVFVGSFPYAAGTVTGIDVYKSDGTRVGVLYGSSSGITLADQNTPGANGSLTLDGSANEAYLTGYNLLDLSSQLGPVRLSIGAGSPVPVAEATPTGFSSDSFSNLTPGSPVSVSDDTGEFVSVGLGQNSLVASVNFFTAPAAGTTSVIVNGDFSASGTKAFDMVHPTKPGKRLRYVAMEAPQPLVLCRGTGTVSYPDHFTDVSEPGSIQLISDPVTGNWIATGIRKGYASFEAEYDDPGQPTVPLDGQ